MSYVPLSKFFMTYVLQAFQQHDVQELNRILFNAIEESLVGTPGQNIINELYHGTIVNQVSNLAFLKKGVGLEGEGGRKRRRAN